jgi:hypothetical protein
MALESRLPCPWCQSEDLTALGPREAVTDVVHVAEPPYEIPTTVGWHARFHRNSCGRDEYRDVDPR